MLVILLHFILSNLFTPRNLTLATHSHNFNNNVQNVSILSCGRPCGECCFHNCVNGVKSSKTVHGLSVCEVVLTDFCSDIKNKFIKCLKYSKHLSRTSASASSVERNVGISCSSAYIN